MSAVVEQDLERIISSSQGNSCSKEIISEHIPSDVILNAYKQLLRTLIYLPKEVPFLLYNIKGFFRAITEGNFYGTPAAIRKQQYNQLPKRRAESEPLPLLVITPFILKKEGLLHTVDYFSNLGFNDKIIVIDPPTHDGVALNAERISEEVDYITRNTDYDKVSLLGYSMGGLQARKVCQNIPNAIEHVITVGAPHYGTIIADYALIIEKQLAKIRNCLFNRFGRLFGLFGAALQELSYGSVLVQEMKHYDTEEVLQKITSFYSQTDAVILPYNSAVLSGAKENIDVGEKLNLHGIGHQGLMFSQRIYDEILLILREKELN